MSKRQHERGLDERQLRSLKMMVQIGGYSLRDYRARFRVSEDTIAKALEQLGFPLVDRKSGTRKMERMLPSGRRATVTR